jgi:hypothetical protein
MALELVRIEGFWCIDPTPSNTTPETLAYIDQLLGGIR